MYYMLEPQGLKETYEQPHERNRLKLVTSNVEIKENFTTEVRNHFDVLSAPSDDMETVYNKLKPSTEEVAPTLPKKENVKNNLSMPTLL